MSKKRFVTTGEIAKICEVSSKTVISWIDKKLLRSFRIGRGPRRVVLQDLFQFLLTKNHSIQSEAELEKILDENDLKKNEINCLV